MTISDDNNLTAKDKQSKIAELQDIIATAEETILSAQRLLANLQPNLAIPETMPLHKENPNDDENGQVIYGFFDGQIMIGDDGKQYPVPANYASKSKLVEGDKLKLTITANNRFVYKQIGPVQRNYLIGLVKQDERGNFTIQTQDKEYKVLLAAATYFKIEPGDEVTLIAPQNGDTVWGAIENVLQKNVQTINSKDSTLPQENIQEFSADTINNDDLGIVSPQEKADLHNSDEQHLSAIEKLEQEMKKEKELQKTASPIFSDDTIKWENNVEELRQEANTPITSDN